MIAPKSTAKPFIELIIATSFWGFGFVASTWCLQYLSAPAIIFYRFLIASSIGLILIIIRKDWHRHLFHEFRISIGGGLLLGLTLILQTAGLAYTTATKSAFITTLYVVIVPLFAQLFFKEKLPKIHWLWVFIALIGTALISELSLSQWNIGDSMTLANAFAASLHILYISHVAPRSQHHFVFNIFQSFWIMLLSASLFIIFPEKWSLTDMPLLPWAGLLSMSIGSSLIGFYLQVKAQKKLNPSVASLLFLLESPLSFVFAFFLLNERLSFTQVIGALTILLACAGASLKGLSQKTASLT